jgi:predicted dehydrogenase
MKLLIIGGGAVSEAFHIPAAIKLLGIENVFVAEPSTKQQEYLMSKFSLQNTFDDYKSTLSSVDAVILATPPHVHVQIMADCFKASKPILCEKPISLTSAEGYILLDLNTNNVLSGMCHTYRLFANRIFVRNLIQKGHFGDSPHIEINEGAPADWPTLSGYCFRKELASGGVLMDGGIHSLDYILWCLGTVKTFDYKDDAIGGLESNASMELVFENKATASFRISRTCELSNTIKISGNNNSIVLDIFDMNKIIENGVERELSIDERGNIPQLDWTKIGEYQTKRFLDAIEHNTALFCSIEDGIRVVETIENCYKQKAERPLPTVAGIPGLRF